MREGEPARGAHPGGPRDRYVLLLYPPHTRNTEPPLGLALVASFLRERGVACRVVDLNALCGPRLALAAPPGSTHRFRRASAHVGEALGLLRSPTGYERMDRYRSAVEFYAAALASTSVGKPWRLTPSDFTDERFSDFAPATAKAALEASEASPWWGIYHKTLVPTLAASAPSMIGISLTYRSQFIPTLALVRWLRTVAAGIPVMCGGPFLDSLPDPTLAWLGDTLDAVVRGPGEPHVARLLGLEEPSGPFRTPHFDGLDFSPYFVPVRVLPFATTRGCYWRRCAFCAETAPYAQEAPERVLARLEALVERWGPCYVHFTDHAIPPAMLSLLASRGSPAPWWGFVRPTEELASPAFAHALARGGCVMLQLGFESASARLLDMMDKGTDPSCYGAILESLRGAGIKSFAYFLFGLPRETEQDREATLALCAAHPPDFLNASLFRLPPSSPLAQDHARFGIYAPVAEPARRYRLLPSDGATRPGVRRWLSGRFMKHPAIRPIVSRTPPYYKSSHAAFLRDDAARARHLPRLPQRRTFVPS